MNPEIFAVVAVVKTSKGVLLTSRRNRPDNFGFPGGKVDPGETPVQAAKREVKEETGLDLFDLHLIYVAPEPTCGNRLVAVYTATVDVDQSIKAEAGLNVIWGDPLLTVREDSAFKTFNLDLLNRIQ